MPRILHAAPYLWSGAGNVITRLIAFQSNLHEVGLVTSPASRELRNWPAYDRLASTTTTWQDRIDLFHRDAETSWTAVRRLRDAVDEFRPDIIHTHAGTPTAVAVLAVSGLRTRIPVVAHFYSWGVDRPAWMNEMDLWAFRQADVVICSASAYQAVLRKGGVTPRRLRMLPWGVSVPDRARVLPRRAAASPVIGTLGRIERRKGQLALVEAFARLHDEWPGVRLEIVGPVAEASYASQIRRAITRLRLQDAVRLTGHVADPSRHLARWSACVSLSSDEGQGLAVQEAMAMGVPVVVLGAAGIEDFVTHARTGLIAQSATDVPRLLGRVLSDPRLTSRMTRSARALIKRRYHWNRTVASVEGIYRRVA